MRFLSAEDTDLVDTTVRLVAQTIILFPPVKASRAFNIYTKILETSKI